MILFFAGGQLILNSVQNLIAGTTSEVPGNFALIATFISISGKALLSWCQHYLGKKTDSAMLKANAKNMLADIFTSVGVLIGLVFSVLFGIGIIDFIVAILIGFWIIKNAISIFLEINVDLMDGNKNDKYYRILFDAVHSVSDAINPHRVRMRRIAGFWDIDIDIEVDKHLTVAQAHEIANRVENAIKEKIEQIFDIMVHVEPKGNKQIESYGLTEKQLSE
jgi:cation diffusion facilitator family transporter